MTLKLAYSAILVSFWLVGGAVLYFAWKGFVGEPPSEFAIGVYVGVLVNQLIEDWKNDKAHD